ncbi:TetR/AcrR family transcriptional regulator [Amycolatopsis sp. FDAARGOS 1241]|uniref:TetR/AcrR family transcriptional regulator n=1 Tax=Amycolatopsis sp. FDAARGOS 1241 TaxID=2778070 RepID=UPI00194F5BCC|nr:TetR/AcrR family transcriptional regulator [Amycolatopsis sp. FDAARGOS 1241]QRP47747.1 TetR/AcrR family transcriptional regulator [Amycolatopsis sp. FDAARGOS 1241]
MTTPGSPRKADGRAARWAGQRERRRREFVEAGLRAIARHGPGVSTEQIAEEAGVARTRLYKHFAGATDLQRAIAERAGELITTEFTPLWDPPGAPRQMIEHAIGAHTRWLADHANLYRYLTRHSLSGHSGTRDVVADVKTAIARQLTTLFERYLARFGLDTRPAEAIAYGVVGLVESSTARWLENPRDLGEAELATLLARWTWHILDDTLRTGGVELDPGKPLPSA